MINEEQIKNNINKIIKNGISEYHYTVALHSNNWLKLHGYHTIPRKNKKQIKNRVLNKNKFKLFDYISSVVDDELQMKFTNDSFWNNFINIERISI